MIVLIGIEVDICSTCNTRVRTLEDHQQHVQSERAGTKAADADADAASTNPCATGLKAQGE